MRAVRAKREGGSAHNKLYILCALAEAAVPDVSSPALISEEREIAVPQRMISKYLKQVLAKKEGELNARDKMVIERMKALKVREISAAALADTEVFEQMDRVSSPAEVVDSESILTLPVRNEDGKSYMQVMRFDPEELARIRKWLLSIDDEHIRQVYPGEVGEELIAQKFGAPNEYVRNVLVRIANTNDTIRQWLFRSADQHHPLWNADGTIKRDLLPDGWTTIHFKGSGEAPILKEDLHLAPRLQDAYFWRKVDRAHPLDRRLLGKEYDMRRNPNGWLFDAIARKVNAVRPADLDKDYFFDLEKDVPFTDSLPWEVDPEAVAQIHSKFLIKDPVIGRVLGNVPQQEGPVPALPRREIMKQLCFRAKLVKTYAEGGDYEEPKKQEGAAA